MISFLAAKCYILPASAILPNATGQKDFPKDCFERNVFPPLGCKCAVYLGRCYLCPTVKRAMQFRIKPFPDAQKKVGPF